MSDMTARDFDALVRDGVPMAGALEIRTECFTANEVRVRLPYREALLRPGGTITGPALFALADIALYGLVQARLGRTELAVTTDMTIHFLNRPRPGDVFARAVPLKVGRRLFIGSVRLEAAEDADGAGPILAHAVGTYSLPPAVTS